MKNLLILSFILFACFYGYAQPSDAYRDSIRKATAADHAQMKEQLGITIPNRPGPSGNPQAPNAANSDESKVNQYVLTNPLMLKNGKQVKTAKDWWEKRRPEIVEDFDREIYGRVPENVPAVTWKVIAEKDTVVGNYPIREKTLAGVV
ncbi:MAG: acetylxylan esterase, partial [Bacteroidetes bacterium]|nr:acetylxylan esterase [Bacteroidota bacterium]